MPSMIYDTLKLSRSLQPAFTSVQAEALASAINDAAHDNVSTKDDIRIASAEIRAEVRTWMIGMFVALSGMTFLVVHFAH